MSSSRAVHVARGTTYVMIQNVATSAGMVVSFAVISRIISPEQMGIYAVLQLISALCQTVGTVALPQAATRYVADHAGNEKSAAPVVYQTLRTTTILASVLAAIVFAAAAPLSNLLLGQKAYTIFFQILAFDVILYTGVLPVFFATLAGLQRFKEAAIVGTVSVLSRQVLIIAMVVLLQSFFGLVLAWVIADLASASIYAVYILPKLGKPRFDFSLRKLLDFSWPLWLSSDLGFLLSWFDRALLLLFVPLATLGVYNVTLTAFGVLSNLAASVEYSLFPAYSHMQNPRQRADLTPAMRDASRYSSFVVAPLALGLLATAKPALTVFVGQAYVDGSGPLMILAGILALTAFGSAIGPMLLALGQTRISSFITMLSVVLSLLIAFFLMPTMGMTGAAIARGFAMIIGTVLTFYFLRRKIKVKLDLEAIAKSLAASAIMAIVVIAVQVPLYSKFLLPTYVLLGAVIYLISLRLLRAIRQADIDLVNKYLGRRLNFITNILEAILLPRS